MLFLFSNLIVLFVVLSFYWFV